MVACMLLILFNGVTAFLEKPYGVRRFVSSYISVRESARHLLSPFLPPAYHVFNLQCGVQLF